MLKNNYDRLYKNVLVAFVMLVSNTANAIQLNYSTMDRLFSDFTGFYGAGGDGALTVNGVPNGPTNPVVVNQTASRLSVNASAGATSVTLTSASGFSSGADILIIIMEGSNQGAYEFASVSSVSSNTLNLSAALKNSYLSADKVQVVRVMSYSNLTINSGGFLTSPIYNSATGLGGVLALKVSGTFTLNNGGGGLSGHISGGGGFSSFQSRGFAGGSSGAGAGPGGGAAGSNAGGMSMSPGIPDRYIMGSGGGSSASTGGNGGGIVIVKANSLVLNGNIRSDGKAAASGNAGGGSGGLVEITANTITQSAGCGTVSAAGGSGIGSGTAGSGGRIFINYVTSSACTSATPAGVYNIRKIRLK